MSNVTYLPWVPSEEGEPRQARVVAFESVSEGASTSPDSPTLEDTYESLVRKLSISDMSAHEVRLWLREKELDEAQAEQVLSKVEHLGYVDDFRLAQQLLLRLTNRKGQGRTAIAMELRKRKLSPNAIDEALQSIDQGAELDRAIEQAMNRAPGLQRLDRATAERRLQGFLARRGYPGDVTREAMRAAFAEYPPVG
jgi:SOS response regulatory protein OraA/RecX